jgi:hypothetical protein
MLGTTTSRRRAPAGAGGFSPQRIAEISFFGKSRFLGTTTTSEVADRSKNRDLPEIGGSKTMK